LIPNQAAFDIGLESRDKIAFIRYRILKLSAFISVDLPCICGCSINQRLMQFKSKILKLSQPGSLALLKLNRCALHTLQTTTKNWYYLK